MVEHLLDPVEVEVIADVLLINFAEELVVLEAAEPVDPAFALLRRVRRTLRLHLSGALVIESVLIMFTWLGL